MVSDELHQRVVEYVNQHPVFHEVLDDDFLSELRARFSHPDHEFPGIYCCIATGDRVNLDVLEAGLRFALDRTRPKRGNKVIGDLRQSGGRDLGTWFELAVVGALVAEFREGRVALYPKAGRKELDAAVDMPEGTVYFEATALNFPRRALEAFREMKREGRNVGDAHVLDQAMRDTALLRKAEDELKQHMPGAPNILVFGQFGFVYDLKHDSDLFKGLWNDSAQARHTKHFAGMFYLDGYDAPLWIGNARCEPLSALSEEAVDMLRHAFKGMAPDPGPHGCFGSPG